MRVSENNISPFSCIQLVAEIQERFWTHPPCVESSITFYVAFHCMAIIKIYFWFKQAEHRQLASLLEPVPQLIFQAQSDQVIKAGI